MSSWGFEYFCGANVVIEIEGMPLLECAGLQVSLAESKRPIYGYSSRHFDGVASGQVIVEGSLLINYVDHNYLFRAIELGLMDKGLLRTSTPPPVMAPGKDIQDQLKDPANTQALLQQYLLDPGNNQAIASGMKEKLWFPQEQLLTQKYIPNPHDAFSGLDIRVTMGDRDEFSFESGLTGYMIQSIHFLGRGHRIAIDEEVIVEEYPFFARNMVHVKMPYQLTFEQDPETGEQVTSLNKK